MQRAYPLAKSIEIHPPENNRSPIAANVILTKERIEKLTIGILINTACKK